MGFYFWIVVIFRAVVPTYVPCLLHLDSFLLRLVKKPATHSPQLTSGTVLRAGGNMGIFGNFGGRAHFNDASLMNFTWIADFAKKKAKYGTDQSERLSGL